MCSSAIRASRASSWSNCFADYLGVRKVIWLERGIAGDDTHGHVDDIARFVAPRTVVTAYEPDRSDPNHDRCTRTSAACKRARTSRASRCGL